MASKDLKVLIEYLNLIGVKEYLENGGNVNNEVYEDGMTPLMYAIKCSHDYEKEKDEEDYQSDYSGYSHVGDEEEKPLLAEEKFSDGDEVILCILRAGADLNAVDSSQRTPLHLALVYLRPPEIIYELVNSGSDVNAKCVLERTPLIYAINGNYDMAMINYFIQLGCDVNHMDVHGTPPMFAALFRIDKYEVVSTLISAGVDINASIDCSRNIVSFFSCQTNCNVDNCRNKELIDLLVANGADLTVRDDKENTIIHFVSCNYLINLCIKSGVSVDSKNKDGVTPLSSSVFYNNFRKVKDLIILFKADVNCVNAQLRTPLHFSRCFGYCSSDDYCWANLLLYHGANLYAKDFRNEIALDILLQVQIPEESDHEFEEDSIVFDDEWDVGKFYGMPVIKYYLLFIDETGLYDYYTNYDDRIVINGIIFPFIDKCRKELNKMRTLLIINPEPYKPALSFYKFCLLKQFYKSNLINISIDQYKYTYKAIKRNFPLYKHLIIMRMKDNEKKKYRRDLLYCLERIMIRSLSVCESDSDVELIFDCKFKVGCYLNCKELYDLFQASLIEPDICTTNTKPY